MEETKTTIQKIINITENSDSLEFGNAGNRLKIYFDASKLDEAKERIKNAKALRDFANTDVV